MFLANRGRRTSAATAKIEANGRKGRKSRGEISIQKLQRVVKKIAVPTAKKKRAFVVDCRCRHATRSTRIISGTKRSRGAQTITGERVTATNSLKRNAQSMKLLHAPRETKYHAMTAGTMTRPAVNATRWSRSLRRCITYVVAPAPTSVMSSSVVFSETPSAPPRSRPATKNAIAERRDNSNNVTASIQNAFQRLSVRNSIDFKK